MRVFGSLRCPKRSLTTGPLYLAEKVHPRMRFVPPKVPRSLSAARSVDRTSFLGFFSLQRHPLDEPHMKQGVTPHLGSALRLSQPLSGFLASPNFVALFHATTIRGIPPSESSPHRNRAPLSRPHLLPCGHSPTCCDAAFRSLSPLVSSTSTLSCGRLISPTTMSSLFTLPKERFPVTLGPNDETRLVPPASPTSKP